MEPTRLSNHELSEAILQTFKFIGEAPLNSPEQLKAREHWMELLSEREKRLDNQNHLLDLLQEAKEELIWFNEEWQHKEGSLADGGIRRVVRLIQKIDRELQPVG